MAITINIYYTGLGDNSKAFAEEMLSSGTVEQIRRIPGNLCYEYFIPLEDANTVLLIDSWSDQSAIDELHASPMMTKIAALREKYDLHMKVERFISDDEIPMQDQHFIRD